jgi:uncharacterized membrane protein
VTAVEDVVLTLGSPREATNAANLAQRIEPIPTACQQLVRVRLVSGIPHDPVTWRVHHAVERQGEDGGSRAWRTARVANMTRGAARGKIAGFDGAGLTTPARPAVLAHGVPQ